MCACERVREHVLQRVHECACVCVSIWLCEFVGVCVRARARVWECVVRMCVSACVHACVCPRDSARRAVVFLCALCNGTHACVRACVHACRCVSFSVCMCVHVRACVRLRVRVRS